MFARLLFALDSYPFLFGVKSAPSIPLFIDNQACLSVTNHPNNSTKSRHIALREFRIRDYHELGMIRPYYVENKGLQCVYSQGGHGNV